MENNSKSLEGKTALVTGSTAGLGFAMASALAQAGCKVVLHGIEPEDSVRPQQELLRASHGVRAGYLRTDLSDVAALERMMREMTDSHGGADILVNNAVVRHFAPAHEFPVEAWDRALAVNLSAAFHTVRLSLPGMRARGWGRIFNMCSVYGMRGTPNRIDYVTTKAALQGMTRVIALENVAHGITCNAICPGSVLTPNSDGRINALMEQTGLSREESTRKFLEGKQPTQRFVDPDHVAQLVVFLCSPAGKDITGAMLPVEGGWLAS